MIDALTRAQVLFGLDSRQAAVDRKVRLGSRRLTSEAASLSPRTIRAYTDDGALLARFLTATGMPTAASNIRREHVEAFIAARARPHRPASAATRYRSLQQLDRALCERGPDAARRGLSSNQGPPRMVGGERRCTALSEGRVGPRVGPGYRAAAAGIERIKQGLVVETPQWANFWR